MVSRRDFVKAVGASTVIATAGLPFTSFAHRYSAGETVNIGVIGTGSRGNWILEVLKNIEGVRCVACCDIIPQRLDKGISLSDPRAKRYTDYKALLDDKDVDGVIISTPLSMHYQMATDALHAGKHVYCEKTMVFTVDEAVKMQEVVGTSDLIFQVGYQHRFNPMYNVIRNLVNNEELFGAFTHAESYWNRNGSWRREVFDPKWERMINWRMYREYSGGLMAELSSHQLDIINWLKGETPTEFSGFGGIDYWKDGRETFDNIQVIHRYPSGFKSMYSCLTTSAFEGFRIKLYGTRATIEVKGEGGHRAFIYAEPNNRDMQEKDVDGVSAATMKAWDAGEGVPLGNYGNDEEPTGKSLIAFADSIRTGKQPVSNIENGKNSAICVALSNEAMQKAEKVNWPTI
jgi:predicted dehydrogenase